MTPFRFSDLLSRMSIRAGERLGRVLPRFIKNIKKSVRKFLCRAR